MRRAVVKKNPLNMENIAEINTISGSRFFPFGKIENHSPDWRSRCVCLSLKKKIRESGNKSELLSFTQQRLIELYQQCLPFQTGRGTLSVYLTYLNWRDYIACSEMGR
jgi:hypothetical protein